MANPLKAPKKTEILLSKNTNDLKNGVIYHATYAVRVHTVKRESVTKLIYRLNTILIKF